MKWPSLIAKRKILSFIEDQKFVRIGSRFQKECDVKRPPCQQHQRTWVNVHGNTGNGLRRGTHQRKRLRQSRKQRRL